MSDVLTSELKLGVLGGGQLGQMLQAAAISYGCALRFLDPDPNASCSRLSDSFVCGDYQDYQTVLDFGLQCDALCIEIEKVNVDALAFLEQNGVAVFPQASVLRIIQDKGLQKEFYQQHQLPSSEFYLLDQPTAHNNELMQNLPFVQKARKGGYDGNGVAVIKTAADLSQKLMPVPSVIEPLVKIKKELAVVVVRDATETVSIYDPVEMKVNTDLNLLDYLASPAEVSSEIAKRAQNIAVSVAEALGIRGILAVEFFLTDDDQLLINEVAPRPHNSGHHTIEAATTSQFAQVVRLMLGLSAGVTDQLVPAAVTINLLGQGQHSGSTKIVGLGQQTSGVFPHLYGKTSCKPGRKMGHLTAVADTFDLALQKANNFKDNLVISARNEKKE